MQALIEIPEAALQMLDWHLFASSAALVH